MNRVIWLTVEVRVSIDLLWLGQKGHLAPSDASKPPAAATLPPARRGVLQSEKDEPEDKLALFFFHVLHLFQTFSNTIKEG